MIIATPTIGAVIAIILILVFARQIGWVFTALKYLLIAGFALTMFVGFVLFCAILDGLVPIIFGTLGLICGVASLIGFFISCGWEKNGALRNIMGLGAVAVISGAFI